MKKLIVAVGLLSSLIIGSLPASSTTLLSSVLDRALQEQKELLTAKRRIYLRSQVGKASYYCCYFHGRTAANGERFDQNAMTAAHMTLPFGTRVRVTNLINKKSVTVRITDRGDFARLGRVIDLSRGAFSRIASVSSGVVPVSLQVVP